ncbi:Sensor histidine kinase RcsC [Paraburkholderia sediminicola]|uniref:Virulence sensor protein BvgS n=1 Tax=Paraburkholderia sediminicola TaxID=458836 RepID=A0A6J5CAM2_9BURK|nr:hybrid sensor histidine kinase/response regulator [Paraburkholderia sediminicola]CAB3729716.1 Sensor histidine kinase RcsC [Paraburkholderia sediminicola]
MPQTLQRGVLGRLRRYQRLLMFGGGMVITAVVLLAAVLDTVSTVRAHIVNERQAFLVDRSLVMNEIQASEGSFRNGLINAELIWSEPPSVDSALVERFHAGGDEMVLQPFPTLRSQLIFGAPGNPPSYSEIDRFLGLATQLARSSTANSLQRGRQLSGYYYNVKRDLAALIPAPSPRDARMAAVLTDRRKLMDALTNDLGELMNNPVDDSLTQRRPVRWMPPSINPLTGTVSVRLAAPAFDHGKPFAVLVTEYEPQALTAPLSVDRFDGTFLIVSAEGQLIATAAQHEPEQALIDSVLKSSVSQKTGSSPRESYRGGIFTIRDQLGDTGWTLVYAFSWRNIASGVAVQIGTAASTTVAILVVLWVLLFMFNRRVFVPVFERSRRVFESEHLSRTLIETAPVGLGLISTGTGVPLLRSPVMVAMASRVVVDAPTLSAELVRRHALRAQEGVSHTERDVVHDDIALPTREGGQVDLAVSLAPARYQGEDVLVTAFTDITAKKLLEQQLRDAKRAADSANVAKSAFLAAMSHEIRTPLNAILGNLELLAHSPLNAVQKDRLTTIRTSSDGLLAIISDVLDFSKIEAGEMLLEQIEFDVVEVAGRALTIFAPLAHAKGVQLYGVFDTASAQPMRGDPVRLGQVLHNLLSNAIKFTRVGKVTLRVSVEEQHSDAAAVVVAIEDTGIGMSPEQQRGLFQAFSQADTSINRRFGGTGLGLALCRRLLDAMGGTIEVASEPHVGSRFTVRLPLDDHYPAAPQPAMFAGELLIFLSSTDEWRAFAEPHFAAWGLRVQAYRHPALVDEATLDAARALIICGEHDTWHPVEENRLVEGAAWVVDCHRDGPAQPVRTGRIVSVSCYSLKGLEAALRLALRGEAPAVPRRADARATDGAPPTMPRRLRVLVAEDNAVNQQLFAEQLAMLGCEARVVDRGAVALDVLSEGHWDVLLTDLSMPEMSGYELAETVHARWPMLPIMAVTAHVTIEERARCEAAGMQQVLTKPLSLGQLADVLLVVAGTVQASVAEPVEDRQSMLGGKPIPAHLRETFTESCAASLAAIRAAQMNEDVTGVLAELHSLKGALGVFGQKPLALRCGEIELRVKQDGIAGLGETFAQFEAAVGTLISN